jgi:XTP/dITP diphosphohydrolase
VKLVVATRNRGKLAELRALLEGWELLTLEDAGVTGEVSEDLPTFAGNAEKKARAALDATGLPSLADDSGLEVDALGGAPGVHSARYASNHDDAANNAKLLSVMHDVTNRAARFRCAIVLLFPDGRRVAVDGTCEGRIATAPRGTHGFGYDPLFLVGNGERTMAELGADEKNAISHRGQALRALVAALRIT